VNATGNSRDYIGEPRPKGLLTPEGALSFGTELGARG